MVKKLGGKTVWHRMGFNSLYDAFKNPPKKSLSQFIFLEPVIQFFMTIDRCLNNKGHHEYTLTMTEIINDSIELHLCKLHDN